MLIGSVLRAFTFLTNLAAGSVVDIAKFPFWNYRAAMAFKKPS